MAELIVKLPYTSEKILYADETEEKSLYFTVENPNAIRDPDNPGADVMRIQNVNIYVKASDIGAGEGGSIYLYSARPETKVAMVTAGKTNKVICRFTMPDELVAVMSANGIRSVPVYITIKYNDLASEHPLTPKYVNMLFENVTILSGRYSLQITTFSTLRSESGLPTDDGVDIMTKMQLAYAPETIISAMDLRLHYAEGRDATLDDAYLSLNSKISTDELNFVLSMQFSNSVDWGFLLYFGDEYENSVVPSGIFKAFANMHLAGAKEGGVCFGGFSKSTDEKPMFECYYPAYFYGGIVQGGGGGYPAVGVEQDTGMKWIDGKPIYRKILQITGANKAGESLSVPLGSFKLGFLIRLDGGFFTGEDFCCFATAHNSATTANVYTRIRYATTAPEIRIVCGSARSIGSGYAIVEYTKAD